MASYYIFIFMTLLELAAASRCVYLTQPEKSPKVTTSDIRWQKNGTFSSCLVCPCVDMPACVGACAYTCTPTVYVSLSLSPPSVQGSPFSVSPGPFSLIPHSVAGLQQGLMRPLASRALSCRWPRPLFLSSSPLPLCLCHVQLHCAANIYSYGNMSS